MRRFRDGIENLMRGRYGTDQLNNAMLASAFILMIAGLFVKSVVFNLLIWGILILMTFRMFSRNFYKRRLENDRFMRIWKKSGAELLLTIRRIKEIKACRFRKCRSCKAVLRLRRKVGKHTVVCPCCNKEFDVRILL